MQTVKQSTEIQPGGPVIVGALYEQAQVCYRQGRADEALRLLEAFLQQRPMHGRGWTQAGVWNHSLGRYDKALACFQRAAVSPDRPAEVFGLTIRTFLAIGKTEQALGLLRHLPEEQAADEALVLELADRLDGDGQTHRAMNLLLGQPSSWAVERKLEALRSKRAKIAIFCGGDGMTFMKDILAFLEKRYPVRLFDGTNTRQMTELMEWSDVSWFEWCSNLAVLGTKLPKVCRTIVRLHRYEAYMPWPREVNWDHVDLLITVGNSTVMRALEIGVPDLRQRVATLRIPNGVNLEQVPFRRHSAGKSLAFVASMRMVKNPMFLLQCMARLHACDPEYRLYIAGRMDDLLVEQYFLHQVKALGLEQAVHFDGWQEDIYAWLADKDYLVCTSVIESQGMGILEAMAAGIKPVIHNFPGAAENFDPKFLFNTPDEFCRLVQSREYDSAAYREFVECRYPLGRVVMQVDEILAAMEGLAGAGAF